MLSPMRRINFVAANRLKPIKTLGAWKDYAQVDKEPSDYIYNIGVVVHKVITVQLGQLGVCCVGVISWYRLETMRCLQQKVQVKGSAARIYAFVPFPV